VSIAAALAAIAHFIGCPLRFATHIPCPGCGMTRAFLSFFTLDIGKAFYYHPLFPLILAAAIILAVSLFRHAHRQHKTFFTFSPDDFVAVLSNLVAKNAIRIFLIGLMALYVVLYAGRFLGIFDPTQIAPFSVL
jgi:hypothetical protein